VRDQIVDFVRRWSDASEIHTGRFIGWLGVTASKLYSWRERYGRANEHNGRVPRDFWLEDWEKQAIIGFHSWAPRLKKRVNKRGGVNRENGEFGRLREANDPNHGG
jgi:hypothetical protein